MSCPVKTFVTDWVFYRADNIGIIFSLRTMRILLLVLFGIVVVATNAQSLRPPTNVNSCYPIGNNVYATKTVLSTELDQYPDYVQGACTKRCTALCVDFVSSQINATAGLCTCVGAPLKCGANAKLSSSKTSCTCKVGYKGDPVKGCTDLDECASTKTVCPVNQGCVNMVGSFMCVSCGSNALLVKNQCQCKVGFEGDAVKGCTDMNECVALPTKLSALPIKNAATRWDPSRAPRAVPIPL
jgi:Calcium-binding EGF domain